MLSTDFLNKQVTVTMDRPLGSKHPKHHFIYPINYGYLKGVPGKDGHDLDVYVLGVFEPLKTFTGICIAVIERINDNDDKLIVVPQGVTYTDEQIRALTQFQERFFTSKILR